MIKYIELSQTIGRAWQLDRLDLNGVMAAPGLEELFLHLHLSHYGHAQLRGVFYTAEESFL